MLNAPLLNNIEPVFFELPIPEVEYPYISYKQSIISIPMSYILMQGSSKVECIELLDCPKCKHGVLDDRVPRGFIVKYLLGFLPLRRYICYACFKKSYIWHKPQKAHVHEHVPQLQTGVRHEHVALQAH